MCMTGVRFHDEKVAIRHAMKPAVLPYILNQLKLLAANHDGKDNRHVFCDREKPVSIS